MEKQHFNIAQEVQKTMDCFSDVQKPELNPYFTSKLKARMLAEQPLGRPKMSLALKLALVFFILLLNSVTIFNYLNNSVKTNSEENIYSAIQSEYSVDATDLYADNLENFNK